MYLTLDEVLNTSEQINAPAFYVLHSFKKAFVLKN